MAFGIGSFLKGVGDDLGDALIPKELAPYLGTIGAMIAPVAPILGLTMGQLASMKMNAGKLDPMQALSVGLGYYGGGGPQNRAEGKLFGQRMKQGIGNFMNPASIEPTYGDRFNAFSKGYNTPTPLSDLAVNTGVSSSDVATGKFAGGAQPEPKATFSDKLFGTEKETAGSEYRDSMTEFNAKKENLKTKLADKEITLEDYKKELGVAKEAITDNRTFLDKTGNLIQQGAEKVMPGFTDADGDFNFTNALTTVGTATTLGTLMAASEELKRQTEMSKAEEGKIWREWFSSYKRSTGRDYAQSPYPDLQVMEKYRQYMAMGGRVGYNEGGDTGIIAAAPGMPEGMQLDGRDGLFISQGVEEKADDVPAMLSKNEFVLTADAMKGFDKMSGGSGDPRAAAQKMYQFMDQMEAIA